MAHYKMGVSFFIVLHTNSLYFELIGFSIQKKENVDIFAVQLSPLI